MRPELPTAVAVDNSASIQPARSIFISWGKSVQISGATSHLVQKFTLARAFGDKFESGGGKADLFHLNLTLETLNWVTFADVPKLKN